MSKQKKVPKIRKKAIIVILGFIILGSIGGYAWINSMIPVNGSAPVFGFGENIVITTKNSEKGFVFASQTNGKKSIGPMHVSPTIQLSKGQLATVRIMNEDKSSKHNFNIDEFNVHSHDLGYFEPQSITFIADKAGTFHYHCTIHPEMNGELIIE